MNSNAALTSAAAEMDSNDPLSGYRELFHFPKNAGGGESIYFTGNSLGLMPRSAEAHILQELADWKHYAVDGHIHAHNPWLRYHEYLAGPMARIVGAEPSETVVMNSLTVNLHLMMVSFFRPSGQRRKIVMEKGSFPSDRYAVVSQLKCHGFDPDQCLIELEPRAGESTLRTEDIVETIASNADSIALVMLGGVNYYTGQVFDMATITRAGHDAGAMVGFDLAHAAGNLQLSLHDWDVDFAVWCCYKYLNGGPGAVAGAFVHERHGRSFDLCRLSGWWGHDKETRFKMGPDFQPLPGAEGWQVSNPPILQMAALKASLEIFDQAGMASLRERSERLTAFLENSILGLDDDRISIITPADPAQRGCQLSVRVRGGDHKLFENVISKGAVVDWREPDVIRVAPAPLYNNFADIAAFTDVLQNCLSEMN